MTTAHAETISLFDRDIITRALEANDFSLTRVAESLRITRHALRYRMQRLNMKVAGETGPARENSEF